MVIDLEQELDIVALHDWCIKVDGLRETIISMGRCGMSSINPPIFGAMLELGLVGNRELMKQAAEELQKAT